MIAISRKQQIYNFTGKDRIQISLSDANKNIMKYRKAAIYSQASGALLLSIPCDENGMATINVDLKKGPFFIISHDPSRQFNGVIADNIGEANYVVD